jgi:hypothetical protein
MQTTPSTRVLLFTGAMLSLCLITSSCSMLGTKIQSTTKGSVYLEEIADWSYNADHPAVVDQTTLLKVVKGVMANEVARGSSKMPASGSTPMRVFSDEDAEFLAPLLAQGLSQAKPEQIVGFKVSPSAGSGAEPTAGTLYVQQGSIYLTITPSSRRKIDGFSPSTVARIEKAPAYIADGTIGAKSIVIDYQILAAGPKPSQAPVIAAAPTAKPVTAEESIQTQQVLTAGTTASGSTGTVQLTNDELLNRKLDELREVREANKAKETEITMLKREVEWMKQELRERSAEVKAIKAAKGARPSTSKNRTADVAPLR